MESALSRRPAPAVPVEVTLGKHFSVGPTGLTIRGAPTFEQASQLLSALRIMEAGVQFALGDAIRYLEDTFGEQASQVIDSEEWSESTVRVYRWAAERVPLENRRPDLSFSHHLAVAGLSSPEQRHWLEQAATSPGGTWPVTRLKAAIRTGADIAPTAWYLLVGCEDQVDLISLKKTLESEGRQVKEIVGRKRLP